MYKIKILGFGVLGFIFSRAYGQMTHEVHLQLNGGISALQYKLSQGTRKVGFGGGGGLGYTFFFNRNCGLGLEANVAVLNTSLDMAGVRTCIPNLTDEYDDAYDFWTDIKVYKEKVRTVMVNIPLVFHFQTGQRYPFFFRLGAQIGLPVASSFSVKGAKYTNSAYYPAYDNTIYDPAFMGYGDFNNRQAKGKLELNISYSIVSELGFKWNIGKCFALYTGFYCHYGLNNIRKAKKDVPFVNLNPIDPQAFTTNSITHAKYDNSHSFSDKASMLAVGIHLRLSADMLRATGKMQTPPSSLQWVYRKKAPNSPTLKAKWKKHKKHVHKQKRNKYNRTRRHWRTDL